MLVRKQNYKIVLTDFSEFNSADAGLVSHLDHSRLDRYLTDYKKGTCEACTFFRGLKHGEGFCARETCKLGTSEITPEKALLNLMDDVVTQIQNLGLPMFKPRVWGVPAEEDVKWDLQVWPVEERLYPYLGDGWDNLCFFFLRGFSQVVIAKFLGCLQTTISSLERQLVDRLRLWNDHLLPTLTRLQNAESILLEHHLVSRPEMLDYLKALIFTTDKNYVYHWFHTRDTAEGRQHRGEKICTQGDVETVCRLLKTCIPPDMIEPGMDYVGLDPAEFTAEDLEKVHEFGRFAVEHFEGQSMDGGFPMRELKVVESDDPNVRHSTSKYKERYAM